MIRVVGVGFAGAVASAGIDKLIGFDDGCGHTTTIRFWMVCSIIVVLFYHRRCCVVYRN